MFGAYRRDDFADPENFLSQLCLVLERYADAVIERATDVRNSDSMQRRCKFPPSISEAGDLLAEEGERQERAKRYAAMPPYERRAWDRPKVHPANVLVSASHQLYPTLRERANSEPDMARIDDAGRLWVPFGWITKAATSFRRFTAADLRAIYARHGEADSGVPSNDGGDRGEAGRDGPVDAQN